MKSATGWQPMDAPNAQVLRGDRHAHGRSAWVVAVDASYRAGRAGIAYTGYLGNRSALIDCDSSTDAELHALLLAMRAAARRGIAVLTFHTDCGVATRPDGSRRGCALRQEVGRLLHLNRSWHVVQIPRSQNSAADRLARHALRRSS